VTEACEKGLARLADAVVSVTPPLADRFPEHPRVAAFNYATPWFFREAARQGREPERRQFDLVHLGTLSRRRAEFLAAVLREFHARRPGSRSLIVGAEPGILREIAGGLPAGCEVVAKVPFAEVPSLLSNARVGIDVHPWQAPHLAPALAVKICEYMACGCAVVASPMPVLEGILEGSGLVPEAIALIPGETPRDYAAAAVRLVEAAQGGQDPGSRLRAFSQNHMNWETEAVKIARLYRELLGR
jgi:glycosyltransferase involved in cell wall biosynthesis